MNHIADLSFGSVEIYFDEPKDHPQQLEISLQIITIRRMTSSNLNGVIKLI